MKKDIKAIKKYDIMLKKHIDNRDTVKIESEYKDGEQKIGGFILKMSRNFLLIQEELEFYLNGYIIIRKDNFDSLRCNKYDRTMKRILKEEGVIEREYGINFQINLLNWQTIFNELKQRDLHVILECKDLEKPLFIIGPIKTVTKDSISIQNYDPTGLLDKTFTKTAFKDISFIRFGDRYSTVFRKYLRKNKSKK